MPGTAFETRPPDVVARLARLRRLAWLLDAQFRVPGTGLRFGVDSLVGLAPVAGDVAMGVVSFYLIWQAKQMGAPAFLLARMMANVGMEVLGGSVPVLGDMFDVVFKANLRNVALLEGWLQRRYGQP